MDRVGNGYRLCMLRDLNGWIGNRLRASVTGAFEVPGENDNRRKMVSFADGQNNIKHIYGIM